jgi:hypothetical protein
MKYLIFIVSFFIISCKFGFDSKHIIDKYYLTEIDGRFDISYNIKNDEYVGVVGPDVIEFGFNDYYIWSKQRNIETQNLAYYIIPLKKMVAKSPDDNKIGPFTKEGFSDKLAELGVKEYSFTIKVE